MAKKLSADMKEMPRMKGLEGLVSGKIPKNARMPDEVDIVTAKDIFCGGLTDYGQHKTHCLLGLACINFGRGEVGEDLDYTEPKRTCAERYVQSELRKSVIAFTDRYHESVFEFNDNTMGDEYRHLIARVWNATMARIGYTEGNPEARYGPSEAQ